MLRVVETSDKSALAFEASAEDVASLSALSLSPFSIVIPLGCSDKGKAWETVLLMQGRLPSFRR